ncbi:hypothetical protein N7456_004575 [Penicillium angulare]|uniref:Uncharacterized protein n=1 Tax=Penicillium angulare TaxID=116970 RepID=A0A9W9FXN2_9EURO|nr:hypothetical protein N7456_004575 [Penicillium angulare]
MPIEYVYSSDDSELSETDISLRGRNGHVRSRRRSVSRHQQRRPEVVKEYLAPAPQTRVYRSHSTGGNRRRERDNGPSVMIVNEQATRASGSGSGGAGGTAANSNKPKTRMQQKYYDESEEEEFEPVRKHSHSRHRAASGVSANVNVGSSRTPSPLHRDYELVMGQRILERSDMRQDMDIWKHQQEIERLERELEKHRDIPEPPREGKEIRRFREEEQLYEDEISERLRRLQRIERKSREEEGAKKAEKAWRLQHLEDAEREEETARKAEKSWRLRKLEETEKAEEAERKAERAWRMKKLEDAEREAAEKEEMKERIKKEKLEEIARQQEEDAERERLKKQFLEEERQKLFEAEEKRKKEMMLKAAAVEEWKIEQERMRQRQIEEAAKRDREFRERLRHDLGYDEEEIAHILNKKKRDEEKKEKEEKKKEKEEQEKKEKEKETKEVEERKTTWIKVHRKHLLPETLLAYNLPWDWDEHDSNYIIIKRWVTEDFQEELFGHTKRIREGKVIAETSHSQTELKVNDDRKDRMYLVRKKAPRHKIHLFAK